MHYDRMNSSWLFLQIIGQLSIKMSSCAISTKHWAENPFGVALISVGFIPILDVSEAVFSGLQ